MAARRLAASAAVVGIGVLASLALTAASSWAAGGMKLCVPKREGAGLVTPKHGKCKKGYTLTTLGAEGKEGKTGAEGRRGPEGKPGPEGKTGSEGKPGTTGFTSGELETLKGILPCIKSVKEGIGGKPTVQFSGCNVQIVNGEGKTGSTNGTGNLVIGYDQRAILCVLSLLPPPCVPGELEEEPPYMQTGSHNLVLGTGNSFTSYGGIVAGVGNTISAPYASISGGFGNTASGEVSSVSGGFTDTASARASSVNGGFKNTASGIFSSVSAGIRDIASGNFASISGGEGNNASGEMASVGGGAGNTASGVLASVSGGSENTVHGLLASVSGGERNTASGLWSSISGGRENKAKGEFSSIFGGHLEETTLQYEAKP